MALIWAMLFTVIAAGMVFAHTTYITANRKTMATRTQRTLAQNFARSGLTDALSWFQRQDSQPVTAFAPKVDAAAVPPISETLDPTLGLVREFEVRGNTWGRYEVRNVEVEDISSQRGVATAGTVWDIRARGVLYRRVDPDKPFDSPPNHIEAVTTLRTEVRSVPLRAPAQAAVSATSPEKVSFAANARVVGGMNPAFAFPDTSLTAENQALIDGLPATTADGVPTSVGVVNYDASPNKVFSMRLDQVHAFADLVAASADVLPAEIAGYRLVFADGNLTLPAGRQQRGQVLLVVNGDLVAEAGNDTEIDGMVYVLGDAVVQGRFVLRGTMVVGGTLEMGGSTEPVTVEYGPVQLDELTEALARYRRGRAVRSISQNPLDEAGGGETTTGEGGDAQGDWQQGWWKWLQYWWQNQ